MELRRLRGLHLGILLCPLLLLLASWDPGFFEYVRDIAAALAPPTDFEDQKYSLSGNYYLRSRSVASAVSLFY